MSYILSALHCVSLSTPSLLWCSHKMTEQLISKRSFTHRKISTMQHPLPSGRICAIKSPKLPLYVSPKSIYPLSTIFLPHLSYGNVSHFFSYFTEPFSLHVIGSKGCCSSILLNMLAYQYLINHTCGSCVTQSFIL